MEAVHHARLFGALVEAAGRSSIPLETLLAEA
jgi:hypothetical protein